MTSTAVYCQFTHLAIACDLTGRQMQLWLRLYELLRHRQDVQLNTSMLLRMLDTSRSQFQRARQALIDQGLSGHPAEPPAADQLYPIAGRQGDRLGLYGRSSVL